MILYPYFSSGDLHFFWKEQLQSLSWLPQVFRKDLGFGTSGLLSLWLDYPFRLVLKILSSVGISYFIIEKLLWLAVFILASYSSYRLAKFILGKSIFTYLAPVVYASNTYFLLLFSGGQLGVALGYAFIPLVLIAFINTIDNQKQFVSKTAISNGLIFALLVCFDLRLAYLTLGIIGLYLLLHLFRHGTKQWVAHISTLGVMLVLAGFIHAFWIIPTLLASNGTVSLGDQFTNPDMLKFLSFADFSHALALLHPNWPDNLFGKVYFLQPEFLVLPILAFVSFIFSKPYGDKKSKVVFFAAIGLLGAFFAKGVNDPFGGIFRWMFVHVPGFVSLRDPTKFYVLIAVSYAVLISYSLQQLANRMKRMSWPLILTFLVFWCLTIRPVFLGRASGNFKPTILPKEYIQLKDFLVSDVTPSRTLWIPQKEKFAYFSDIHPILTSDEFFNNASVSSVIAFSSGSTFIRKLSDAGVKYVIVPEDIEKRLFLNDYQYDPQQRDSLIAALGKTQLKRVNIFQNVAVFENDRFTMHESISMNVARQQQLADVGVLISVLTLVGLITSLVLL